MSWVTGYMIVAGLLTANMTVAYSLSEYIIGKHEKITHLEAFYILTFDV